MTRIETETAEKLGMTVKAAAVVNYPGWFQHEAIKRQFRGPLAIPMRSMVAGVGRQSREAGQAALAAAGLPELGILAVTDQGIHVLTTEGILRSSPEEEVLFLPAGSQYDERPRRYTFRNPEIASDDWTRIDRARRPRSCVYRDAGGLRELWFISYRHSAFRCSQRAF